MEGISGVLSISAALAADLQAGSSSWGIAQII